MTQDPARTSSEVPRPYRSDRRLHREDHRQGAFAAGLFACSNTRKPRVPLGMRGSKLFGEVQEGGSHPVQIRDRIGDTPPNIPGRHSGSTWNNAVALSVGRQGNGDDQSERAPCRIERGCSVEIAPFIRPGGWQLFESQTIEPRDLRRILRQSDRGLNCPREGAWMPYKALKTGMVPGTKGVDPKNLPPRRRPKAPHCGGAARQSLTILGWGPGGVMRLIPFGAYDARAFAFSVRWSFFSAGRRSQGR